MTQEIKENNKAVKFLEEHFDLENDLRNLHDAIIDSKRVHQGKPDEHRWYTFYDNVYEIQGRFFTTFSCSHKSECQSDSDVFDEERIQNSIHEVFPHEVTTTIYK